MDAQAMPPAFTFRGPESGDIRQAVAQVAAALAGVHLAFVPDPKAKTSALLAGSISLTSCSAIAKYIDATSKVLLRALADAAALRRL